MTILPKYVYIVVKNTNLFQNIAKFIITLSSSVFSKDPKNTTAIMKT